MKYLSSTMFASLMGEQQMRRNIRALLKYLLFLTFVIILYAVLFHIIMWEIEGQRHSWVTGIYWTLTVMSTLGFGDITFTSDIGRAFSVLVLLSGIILLLVLLPFVFIRYFYAPWLEAQVRRRAPREAPADTRDHVVIVRYDIIAPGLIERLTLHDIPYFVAEPDMSVAAEMRGDGLSVVAGALDARQTYERLRADRARLVFANADDTTNTNVILTVREIAPDVPIAATAELEDSMDILALAGATEVLALKQRLGEHLANRVNAGHAEAHVIGSFHDLLIAEFSAHNTPLRGRAIREIGLREATGVNIVGVWEEARLLPPNPDLVLTDACMPVVVGTREQIDELNEFLYIYDANYHPVLILGGGKVGRSAARALKRRGVAVHMIEKKKELEERIGDLPDRLFIGDAAHLNLLMEAGLADAPSVILSTNDDAMNIYLAVYCRRLSPDVRIVSRITHERNVEAIRRAGADLALSYAKLGEETVYALLQGRPPVLLGEEVSLLELPIPDSLEGKTLAESEIGARTGLNVIAFRESANGVVPPYPGKVLSAGGELIMIGKTEQLEEFQKIYD